MSKAAAQSLADAEPVANVRVELGERSYPILIGAGVLDQAGRHMAPLLKRNRVVIVTDETVAGLHLERLQSGLDAADIQHQAILLPPGEATKSFERLADLSSALLNLEVERGDLIVALGGGVIGDLAGFTAAILKRGVDFVQVPTTLLAQVDSSVGGKTGINTPEGKNLVGAFHQPRLVVADTDCLKTLPPREFLAGYAEVVKYGLIDDPKFFASLGENLSQLLARDDALLAEAVETSCRAKARIVVADEREGGVRALLNLGHTFGHALEAAGGFSEKLLHGEGVAIGMVCAFRLSARLGLCPEAEADAAEAHLADAGLPTRMSVLGNDLPSAEGLVDLMRHDKKVADGRLTFILARGIGKAFITRDVGEAELLAFLEDERAR